MINYQKLKVNILSEVFTNAGNTRTLSFPVLVNSILKVLLNTLGEQILTQEAPMFTKETNVRLFIGNITIYM